MSSAAVESMGGTAGGEQMSFWERAKRTVSESWSTIRWFVAILALVVAAALFAHWNAQRAQQFSAEELNGIRKLVVFAGKSAREAQKTQANSLQALLHVNYALCFVNAAKHMVGSAATLQQLTNVNVAALQQHLVTSQAHLLNKIRAQCVQSAAQRDLLQPEAAASSMAETEVAVRQNAPEQ